MGLGSPQKKGHSTYNKGPLSVPGAKLDCHHEIIRKIAALDKVNAEILFIAQAAVYKSMERRWSVMSSG